MKIVSAGMHTIIMPRTKTQQIRQMLSVLRFLNRKSIYIKTQNERWSGLMSLKSRQYTGKFVKNVNELFWDAIV